MRVSITTRKETLSIGSVIPPEQIIHKGQNRSVCYFLQEAKSIHDDSIFDGNDIIIKGLYYQVENSRKQYQLTDKFGILAVVKNNKVYPLLREAVSKEKIVFQRKEVTRFSTEVSGDKNNYWPIIKEIPNKKEK
jgi:hypothetical protein